MSIKTDELEKALIQLRRIEEHREVGAEKAIRKLYKSALKDLKQFIGYEYAELAKDGKLTVAILQEKGEYARFLEEVEQRLNGINPTLAKEIRGLVEDTYRAGYNGMQEAVTKANSLEELHDAMQGLHTVTPEAVKNVIEKGLVDEVLKKNWQESIYDIKRNIVVGLATGDRVETMAKRMTQSLDMSYKKAVTVARTETHRAREAGFHDSAFDIDQALQQGTTGKRMVKIWRTMQDERVRPNVVRKTKKGWKRSRRGSANHEIMDGVTIPVDEKFTLSDGNTTIAPSQSGIASQDINCRCYLSYKLMNDETYFKTTGKHFS